MNSKLELEIQARLNPVLEGADNLEQTIREMSSITGSVQTTQSEQPHVDKLNSIINKGQTRGIDLTDEFRDDLIVSGGTMSPSQSKYHHKNFLQYERSLEKEKDEFARAVESGSFDEKRKVIFNENFDENLRKSREGIKSFTRDMEKLRLENKEAEKSFESFFETLKRSGGFAVAGMALHQIGKVISTQAEIAAKEKTSFDLTSPMGMYSEKLRFDTFKETRERENIYSTVGMFVGGIGGFAAGGPWGAAAGGMAGKTLGSEVAKIINMNQEAETEEELKYISQSWNTISGYVNSSSQYDIIRAKLRARLGSGAGGRLGLGYGVANEQQMRMQFGDTLGYFDDEQYRDQTTFARAEGLDPSEIYKLNLSGRVTGADYSLQGLDEGKKFAQRVFGEDASSTRIVDVLKEIKGLNEKMLTLNIDADAKDSMKFAMIPELLFGTDSAYGRLGDLGGQTLKTLEGLGKPKNDAHLALLYRAYGTDDIVDFSERMKGGIYSGDNLKDILSKVNKDYGYSFRDSYLALRRMIPDAPQGFLPQLATLTSGGSTNIDRRPTSYKDGKVVVGDIENVPMTLGKLFEEQKRTHDEIYSDDSKTKIEKAELYSDALKKAYGNISETESKFEQIEKLRLETAEKWRTMAFNAEKEMAKFWGTMGDNSELQKKIIDITMKSIEEITKKQKSYMPSKSDLIEGEEGAKLYRDYLESYKDPKIFWDAGVSNMFSDKVSPREEMKRHLQDIYPQTDFNKVEGDFYSGETELKSTMENLIIAVDTLSAILPNIKVDSTVTVNPSIVRFQDD